MRSQVAALGLIAALLLPFDAYADAPSIPTYPNLAQPFDWQVAWGSIHLNSYADGLNDPGTVSSTNGVVPCAAGTNECSQVNPAGIAGGGIVHGIKYDIKNSVVNCASSTAVVGAPNMSYAQNYVCNQAPINSEPLESAANPKPDPVMYTDVTGLGFPNVTLVYSPMWDPRSNDWSFRGGNGGSPGCQQEITNTCVRDIYDCKIDGSWSNNNAPYNYPNPIASITPRDRGPGATYPVTHVFSPEEEAELGIAPGGQLPSAYYYYEKKSTSKGAVSLTAPQDDFVDGTVEKVSNYSKDLANIQAYKVTDVSDSDSFIVVDPSNFFNMSKYTSAGLPTTEPPQNCPVLQLGLYDGICDPNGVAGCNLPIYGDGAPTRINGHSGISPFPVLWSGYVNSWSFITPLQYVTNTKNRQNLGGATIYLPPLNDNNVLMISRASSYCTNEEMTSDPKAGTVDLPCVQYLQYSNTDGGTNSGQWVDLYNPTEDTTPANNVASYVIKYDYNIQPDGSLGSQVMGSDGKPVSFFDHDTTFVNKDGQTLPAVQVQATPNNSSGVPAPGVLMGNGTGIHLQVGTTVVVQLNDQSVQWQAADAKYPTSVNCMEITNAPPGTNDYFIPTNTQTEYQSFVSAVAAGSVPNVTEHECQDQYKLYNGTGTGNPNGTQTWIGTVDCSGVTPSCGQVQTISAQRYCLRPTGLLGNCSECANATDPDNPDGMTPLNPGKYGTIVADFSKQKGDYCYYQAICTSQNACPGVNTGGHVFCLAPDTKILMGDGTQKAIIDVKAGDEVMAFDHKHSRGILKKARVKASEVTEKQKLVEINDLKITPTHKIVLANGRAVKAEDVKVGDKILKADGLYMTVTVVKKDKEPVAVYNLSLDNADGYVANGLRVLEYTIPEGLVHDVSFVR